MGLEVFGMFAFAMIIINFDLPDKFKKLKKRVKKLESKMNMGGDILMSEILKDLEGKKCTIIAESDFTPKLTCTVLKVGEEWIKVVERDKKGNDNTRILKVENIKEISEIE